MSNKEVALYFEDDIIRVLEQLPTHLDSNGGIRSDFIITTYGSSPEFTVDVCAVDLGCKTYRIYINSVALAIYIMHKWPEFTVVMIGFIIEDGFLTSHTAVA